MGRLLGITFYKSYYKLYFHKNADDLRMAVKEVVCDNDKERRQYEEALVAITVDESLRR